MDRIESILAIAMKLIVMFFEDGLPMLARNLLDGMRATPCIQQAVEFFMGLEDAICKYIAAGLGVLVSVAFVMAIGLIGRITTTYAGKCRAGNQALLVGTSILMGLLGFLALVFLAASCV